VVGGLLYIGVQIKHPNLDLALITTTQWKVRQTMKVLFASLSLAGITGMYLLPANPRITVSPAPVVVHITSAVADETLGTFQFSSGFRRRRPGWHRASGRVGLRLMRTLERPLSIVTLMPRAHGARGGLDL
jgi:hypothetical protein